jgi:hypothetical protein
VKDELIVALIEDIEGTPPGRHELDASMALLHYYVVLAEEHHVKG